MAHDVFVSYEHHDKAVADAVCAALESRRIRCWIAPRDVTPGMAWAEEIVNAVAGSRILVLVFSANTNAAQQVLREVNLAADTRIPILPFRIEDVALSPSFRFYIGTQHWLDALTPPLEEHLQRLGDAVERWLGQPAAAERAAAPIMPAAAPAGADPPRPGPVEAPSSAPPRHFCGHCGGAVAANAPFCGHCGAQLTWGAGGALLASEPPPRPYRSPAEPSPAAGTDRGRLLVVAISQHKRFTALAGLAVLVLVAALTGARMLFAGTAPGCPGYAGSASMTYDGRDQQTVLFGGVNAQGDEVNDTCTWNGSAWTRLSLSGRPPARAGAALAYDAAHQQVVLFSGEGSGSYRGQPRLLSDTWTWEGHAWTPHRAAGPVVSHGLVSLAYDAGHQQLLLVDDAGRTWIWNGSAWSQTSTENGPPNGNPGAMAYDANHQQVVLLDSNGITWTWDGTNWTRQPAVPPYGGGIAGTALAYDAATQQVVLVSGTGDTSTWDGHAWTRQSPAHQPSAAIGQANLAYDEARQLLVLYLPDYAQRAAGTWTWDGHDWTQR